MFFYLFGSSPPTPYLIHKKTIQALKRWLFWGSSLPSSLSAGSQIKSLGLNTLSQIYRPILRWAEQDIFHGSFRETLLTMCVPDAQSCLTLRDPMDCSLPGSSVHGILQERILEWVAVPFSRDLPNWGIKPTSPTLWADSVPSEPPGKPLLMVNVFKEKEKKNRRQWGCM